MFNTILQSVVEMVVGLAIISSAAFIALWIINKRVKKGKVVSRSSFQIGVDDKDILTRYSDLDMNNFDDIGGLHEVKEELKKYVKCFDSRKEFYKQNVEIPRGILLWGPPGCGKTSLAKAIAKEAKVNFICRNASDLIDKGIFGTNNAIEKLFEDARKMAPCIVFIDELDIIGSRYIQGGMAGAHQTDITKLLAEMDGFQKNSDIMLIAATNDMNKLDKALLRSGRLGKKYYIGPPTSKRDILEVVSIYKKGKRLKPEVTDDVLATIFNGYSPADIKAVFNECGVKSILDNTDIDVAAIRNAIIEVGLQTNIGNIENISEKRKKHTARHEAGHAIVAAALGVPVQTITILGTSTNVAGLTELENSFSDIDPLFEHFEFGSRSSRKPQPIYSEDSIRNTLNHVVILYGGVAAELAQGISYVDLDLGCADDLKKAAITVGELVTQTLYTEEKIVDYSALMDSLGAKITQHLLESIYKELGKAQDKAVAILKNNMELLDTLAEELEERITISDDQLKEILSKVNPWIE